MSMAAGCEVDDRAPRHERSRRCGPGVRGGGEVCHIWGGQWAAGRGRRGEQRSFGRRHLQRAPRWIAFHSPIFRARAGARRPLPSPCKIRGCAARRRIAAPITSAPADSLTSHLGFCLSAKDIGIARSRFHNFGLYGSRRLCRVAMAFLHACVHAIAIARATYIDGPLHHRSNEVQSRGTAL